jgi:hypothetical protein
LRDSPVTATPFQLAALSLITLESPAGFTGVAAQRRPGTVRWDSTEPVGTSRFILSRNQNLSNPVSSVDNPPRAITLPALTEGTYYWTIRAQTPSGVSISPSRPASFQVSPVSLPKIVLDSPSSFTEAEAQTRPGTVRWSSGEVVGNSRFILSRNANPLTGTPIRSVSNPPRSITLPALTAGTYYWTVQAQTPDGFDLSPAAPASFRVLPVTPLARPQALHPERNSVIDSAYVQRNRNITFSWSPVAEANAYHFRLLRPGAPTPIVDTSPSPETSYRLENMALLENGEFIWQVEALIIRPNGTVERRGETAEYRFGVSIPQPGAPALNNPGTLYGL